MLLEARGVSKSLGGQPVLRRLDLQIRQGEIVGLIGPNGSGKTTLFDCLSRLQSVDEGRIFLDGHDITAAPPHQVARLGLARTFQILRIYRGLSVRQNLLASRNWSGETLWRMLWPRHPDVERRALELAGSFDLPPEQPAGLLSGGQRRLLELAMALMPEPRILLLDEAMSGVLPALVERMKRQIRRLSQESGKTFLLVEHDLQFILDLCTRVVVLHEGRLLADAAPEEIRNNPDVLEAYFGSA